MFDTIRNAWKIADLRKKILFTALILLIFRIGSAIPVPFLDASVMQAWYVQCGRRQPAGLYRRFDRRRVC